MPVMKQKEKHMKKQIKILMLLTLALALFAGCSSNKTVLTVGDQEATVGEATFRLRELEAMYVQQYGEAVNNQGAGGVTFADLVNDELVQPDLLFPTASPLRSASA